MDMSVESTSSLESSESPCTLPKPTTGESHAPPPPVSADQVTESMTLKTQAYPTAVLQCSKAARFSIRSAKSLCFDQSSESKQNDLGKLLSYFEAEGPGMATEEGRGSQADDQEGALVSPTRKVSMVIISDTPDTPITTKTEPWTIQLKSLNQAKVTGAPSPATRQIRLGNCPSEAKPEPRDTENQGDQSRQGLRGRGRAEWREVNFQNRSKSLDWRGRVSGVDRGERAGIQQFGESHGGILPRRAESLERGGCGDNGGNINTPTTKKVNQSCPLLKLCVSSRIKDYTSGDLQSPSVEQKKTVSIDQTGSFGRNTPVALALERASKGQSLPSRIKPRLSPCGVEGNIDVWGLRNGTRRAGDLSPNQSILDRIEKLFASTTSDTSTKRDAGSTNLLKANQNSVPVGDWLLDKQGVELNRNTRISTNNPALGSETSCKWVGVSYEGEQGGTFPRISFKVERNICEPGSNWISRSNENDGNNMSSLKSASIVKGGSAWPLNRSSGRLQQPQPSLTEREGSGSHNLPVEDEGNRSLDSGMRSQPFSVQPRSMASTPKDTSPQQQVQSSADRTPVFIRDTPLLIQSRAVTDGGEKEKEGKKGKEELKKDKEPDLEPGKEKERNVLQYEGRVWGRKAEEETEKHKEREKNNRENKEPKPLKAMAICERSPTMRFCRVLDWSVESLPKHKLSSTSQAASAAWSGMNKESKQGVTDHTGVKSEHSLTNQPIFQPSETSKWKAEKLKGNGEEDEEDVSRINSTVRGLENRPDGELKTGVISFSSDNVRSKIHRFESLSQQSQSLPPCHLLRSRRAFSVPSYPNEVIGVKKSKSDVAVGEVTGQGPGSIKEKPHCKTEEGCKINWEVRSVSVDEVEQRRGGRGREIFGSVMSPTQQTKQRAYKESSCNSTINTKPQGDFEVFFDEPDSSKESQPETKCTSVLQREISKLLVTKSLMATMKTNFNNSNGVGIVTDTENIGGKNFYDSINEYEVGERDKTPINCSIRSPFIPDNKSNESSGNICSDQESNSGTQASTSAQSTTDATRSPAVKLPLFRNNGIPILSSALAPASGPGSIFPPPATSSSSTNPHTTSSSSTDPHNTSSSSTDPHTCSGVIPQNQAKNPQGSFGVCLARWSSDEEESDDDDDEGTEKGSNYDSDSAESSVTITSNMSQSDRLSFSVSLADLCHLGGVDLMGYNDDPQHTDSDRMSHRTASLSSDISALSYISILPTDELDRLLEDVRGLEDETLQNYEAVQVVVLHKEVGCGLGFTVAGGVDQNKPITVHKVFPFGLASQEGSIREGDQVLSINGTVLKTSAHWEALRTLRRARTRGMAVVVLQKDSTAETQKDVADHPQAVLDQGTVQKGRTLRVVLTKSSTDLGFSLQGGLGSSEGDRPLTVKKLFQGGPVVDVFPGDELLKIEGQSLQGLRRLEAWNLIKKVPPGPVEVVLHRPFRP